MKKTVLTALVFVLLLCGCANQNASVKVSTTDASTVTETIENSVTGAGSQSACPDVFEAQIEGLTTRTGNCSDTINVDEAMYVTKINEIYNNYEEYLGARVIIEGSYETEEYEGVRYNYVSRTGPGCCGNDGSMCGFELHYGGAYPDAGQWIRVTGKLFCYNEGENVFLTLEVETLEKTDTTGKRVVS